LSEKINTEAAIVKQAAKGCTTLAANAEKENDKINSKNNSRK
jgi:hypothetical protein